jgi:hypothetical protein
MLCNRLAGSMCALGGNQAPVWRLVKALASHAAEPVAGSALRMGNGQHAYFFFSDEKYERIREPFEESPPNLERRIDTLEPRERSRASCEEGKDRGDFGEEVASKTSLPTFVPQNRSRQFVRDFRREPDWNHSRVRLMRFSIRF